MEDLWSFSPTSESYLQRFLTAANENQAPESRWLQFFQQREKLQDDVPKNNDSSEDTFDLEDKKLETFQNIIDAEDIAHYSFVIENNLEARFTDIVQECVKDRTLFVIFAENLHLGVVEKFLNYSFKQTDLPNEFIKGILTEMFPVLLKKNSRNSIIMLITSHFKYRELFLSVVLPTLLLQDISEELFLHFVQILSEAEKNELMAHLCKIKLKGEQFIKHLPSILEVYKDVNKTNEIQKFILENLVANSELCCNDKGYGRLLLTYLQNVTLDSDSKELLIFSNLVSNHYSIFKRPCENVYNALSLLL